MTKEFEVEGMYITVYNSFEDSAADMFSEQLSEEYYDECMELLWDADEEGDKEAAEELNEKIYEMGGVYFLRVRIGAPIPLKRNYDEDDDEINSTEEKIRAELLERIDMEEAEMIIEALRNLDENESEEEITSILIVDEGIPIYYYEGEESLGYGDRGYTKWVAQYRTADNEIVYVMNLEVG